MLGALVLATAGVIGLAVFLLTGGEEDPRQSGGDGPASSSPSALRSAAGEYLAGPGAPALRARAVSESVVGHAALLPEACSATLEAMGIARAGAPPLATLAAVPDEELATLLLNEEAARTELLQNCADGGVPPGLVEEVRELDGLVDARLRAHGVEP